MVVRMGSVIIGRYAFERIAMTIAIATLVKIRGICAFFISTRNFLWVWLFRIASRARVVQASGSNSTA
jgi:hypothetical protein